MIYFLDDDDFLALPIYPHALDLFEPHPLRRVDSFNRKAGSSLVEREADNGQHEDGVRVHSAVCNI
jgi:hypothetical protein